MLHAHIKSVIKDVTDAEVGSPRIPIYEDTLMSDNLRSGQAETIRQSRFKLLVASSEYNGNVLTKVPNGSTLAYEMLLLPAALNIFHKLSSREKNYTIIRSEKGYLYVCNYGYQSKLRKSSIYVMFNPDTGSVFFNRTAMVKDGVEAFDSDMRKNTSKECVTWKHDNEWIFKVLVYYLHSSTKVDQSTFLFLKGGSDGQYISRHDGKYVSVSSALNNDSVPVFEMMRGYEQGYNELSFVREPD